MNRLLTFPIRRQSLRAVTARQPYVRARQRRDPLLYFAVFFTGLAALECGLMYFLVFRG